MSKVQQSPFFELATLIDAGIPPEKAITSLNRRSRSWQHAAQSVSKGDALSDALLNNQLIHRFDFELLKLAEVSGRLGNGLHELATITNERESAISRIKAKLFFPFSILIVAILVSTLLKFLASNLSVTAILFQASVQLILAIALIKLCFLIIRADTTKKLSWFASFNGFRWYRVYFQQMLFQGLLWQINSGIDMRSAFRRLAGLIDHKPYRKKLNQIAAKIERGALLSDGLKQADLPIESQFIQLISTADNSGAWSSILTNQLKLNKDELESQLNTLTEWLPRVFYAMVVILAISTVF